MRARLGARVNLWIQLLRNCINEKSTSLLLIEPHLVHVILFRPPSEGGASAENGPFRPLPTSHFSIASSSSALAGHWFTYLSQTRANNLPAEPLASSHWHIVSGHGSREIVQASRFAAGAPLCLLQHVPGSITRHIYCHNSIPARDCPTIFIQGCWRSQRLLHVAWRGVFTAIPKLAEKTDFTPREGTPWAERKSSRYLAAWHLGRVQCRQRVWHR